MSLLCYVYGYCCVCFKTTIFDVSFWPNNEKFINIRFVVYIWNLLGALGRIEIHPDNVELNVFGENQPITTFGKQLSTTDITNNIKYRFAQSLWGTNGQQTNKYYNGRRHHTYDYRRHHNYALVH